MEIGALVQLKPLAIIDSRSLFKSEQAPIHGKIYTVKSMFFGSYVHNSHVVYYTLEELNNPKVRLTAFNEPREIGFKANLFEVLLPNISNIEKYINENTSCQKKY